LTIFIERGGVHLHVRDEGSRDGRVVMFSNSLGTDTRVWDLLLPLLPGGLRLVRYDKRGHGLSDVPPAPYRMEDLVEDAGAVADALGVQDVTFVGLSIGGLIGQGLAAARPDLVKALVLMDTAAKIGTDEIWQERLGLLATVGLEGMADAVMERWFSSGFLAERTGELAIWRNLLLRTPAEGYGGCCSAIMNCDFRGSTAELALPVMAMVGAEDGATTPDVVRATAELCSAAFHEIPQAGHLPCVERPDVVAKLIGDFLEQTG